MGLQYHVRTCDRLSTALGPGKRKKKQKTAPRGRLSLDNGSPPQGSAWCYRRLYPSRREISQPRPPAATRQSVDGSGTGVAVNARASNPVCACVLDSRTCNVCPTKGDPVLLNVSWN